MNAKNNYRSALVELVSLSRLVGARLEYVQGGGGNTSVKVAGGRMIVKASGSLLKDVTVGGRGFVFVDYPTIRNFFQSVGNSRSAERKSTEVIAAGTEPVGANKGRASIEAGFHSLLGRFVIHTHSVYANIIACSRDGEAGAAVLGKFAGGPVAWVPYARPGFRLTRQVAAVLDDHEKRHGRSPQVLLLQNHGLIVTAPSARRAAQLHEQVNARIKKVFHVSDQFPPVRLRSAGTDGFVDASGYLNGHLSRHGATGDYFVKNVICPDQIVYGCGGLSLRKSGKTPIFVDSRSDNVYYKGTKKEASAAAETLVGVAYVLDQIENLGWKPSYLATAKVRAVLGMDAEKYRQQLLK